MLACWQPFPRLALIMSGSLLRGLDQWGTRPQRSAINSRWAILPQPGDRIWVVGATLEARSDFLDEECEFEELGENLGFGQGISATHRAPILAASLLHHCI
jgi:hypothetical protein